MPKLPSLFLVATLLPALAVAAEPLVVFVSVLPQKTFVERIGGEHVRVRSMVQPGHSPATHDPTPRQVAELATADLYLRIGVPFEDAWMARIRAASPEIRVLDIREGIDPLGREPDHAHGHGDGRDAHVWTSPTLAKVMIGNIRDALVALDPSRREIYEVRYAAFAAELDDLDREIRERLAGLSNRSFMVFHPAWDHFAETYDLTQVPIERDGKEPGARALTALIDRAERERIRVIFVQPQFDQKAARRVAEAIGGRVEPVDPLATDYVDNLRRFARLIAEASGS